MSNLNYSLMLILSKMLSGLLLCFLEGGTEEETGFHRDQDFMDKGLGVVVVKSLRENKFHWENVAKNY